MGDVTWHFGKDPNEELGLGAGALLLMCLCTRASAFYSGPAPHPHSNGPLPGMRPFISHLSIVQPITDTYAPPLFLRTTRQPPDARIRMDTPVHTRRENENTRTH